MNHAVAPTGDRRAVSTDDAWSLSFATTDMDLLASLRLVQRRYELRGYLPEGEECADLTLFHILPGSRTVVVRVGSRIVATATYVRDSPLGLPADLVFSDSLTAIRAEGRRMVEISGLAIDERIRAEDRGRVGIWLFQVLEEMARRSNVDDMVITVNPRHVGYYSRRLGFGPMDGPRPHPSVQGADAVLMRQVKEAAVDHLVWWNRKKEVNEVFVSAFLNKTQPWVWDSARLTEWAQRMRFAVANITEGGCSYLRNLFPEFEWSRRCAGSKMFRSHVPFTDCASAYTLPLAS